jgi:hypothetical protein
MRAILDWMLITWTWFDGKKTAIGVLLIALVNASVDFGFFTADQVQETIKWISYFTLGSTGHKVIKGELGNPIAMIKKLLEKK